MDELTLRELRLKIGMTMDEMAAELKIHRQTYFYWENKNNPPEDAMQKIHKLYEKVEEFTDDDIDIIEKIGTIKRYYKLSYDNLAQLVGAKTGMSVVNWLNGVQPRLKHMIRINELYYEIVRKKQKEEARSRDTFCRINPLDKESWKVKSENKVITWL